MDKQKKQHILTYIDFSQLSDNLTSWVQYIHNKFEAPMDFLFVIDHNTDVIFGKNFTRSDIEKRMTTFRKACGKPNGKDYIREGCNCSLLSQLAEETDALFCMSTVHAHNDVQFLSSSTMAKMLRKSRIPCLVIPRRNQFSEPELVSLGTNMKRDQKSVAPWITFLGKHLTLPVEITYNSKDQSIMNNVNFIAKFLKNHDVTAENIEIKTKTGNIDKLCLKNESRKLIHCLYLKETAGFMAKVFSDSDGKLMDNPCGQAVFCINPQKDLFIPCT